MARRKPSFREGTWFTVPLRRGAYALGLVARVDRSGVSFLGYYFAPGYSRGGELDRLKTLTPSDAILIGASGTYGFSHKTWSVISEADMWNRNDWPIPVFTRRDSSGHIWYETYGDDDVLLPIRANTKICDARLQPSAIEGTLMDAGAVEDALWYKLRYHLPGAQQQLE